MMHLAAFYQSVDPGAALTQIDAVTDQAIFTNGKDVRVPSGMGNLLWERAISKATGPKYGQVQSPTLRDLANQDINPVDTAEGLGAFDAYQDHGLDPRALTAAESVNFAIEATGGVAAANYGLICLGDGAVKPTTGKIFSVRATGAAALSAGSWVNTALTFNSTLPAGKYQVVGLWGQGANLAAARLVFIGGTFRPGVPTNSSVSTNRASGFRMGRYGVFGEFDTNQPPTVDCLGITDTAQAFILDLIKTG